MGMDLWLSDKGGWSGSECLLTGLVREPADNAVRTLVGVLFDGKMVVRVVSFVVMVVCLLVLLVAMFAMLSLQLLGVLHLIDPMFRVLTVLETKVVRVDDNFFGRQHG